MASGLAVIAYNYAAAKIHIRHGETGVLVPYGESRTFIDTAAKLVEKTQSLHQMRRRAREYAASLDWRRVVERFDSLLTSACGGRQTIFNGVSNFGHMPETGRM